MWEKERALKRGRPSSQCKCSCRTPPHCLWFVDRVPRRMEKENFIALIVASVARGSIQRDRIDPFLAGILLCQRNQDRAILLDPSSSHFRYQPSSISYGSPPFCFSPSFIMLFQGRWKRALVQFSLLHYRPLCSCSRYLISFSKFSASLLHNAYSDFLFCCFCCREWRDGSQIRCKEEKFHTLSFCFLKKYADAIYIILLILADPYFL